jgi:hypothetical protein
MKFSCRLSAFFKYIYILSSILNIKTQYFKTSSYTSGSNNNCKDVCRDDKNPHPPHPLQKKNVKETSKKFYPLATEKILDVK